MVIANVAFIIYLDDNVAISFVENPLRRVLDGLDYCSFITEALILSKIEISENDDHAEFVRATNDPIESVHVGRPQGSIRCKRRIVPRLGSTVPVRATPLQVECKCQETVFPPDIHGLDEFVCVAVRIPFASIGISPLPARNWIQVVENSLHQTGVH